MQPVYKDSRFILLRNYQKGIRKLPPPHTTRAVACYGYALMTRFLANYSFAQDVFPTESGVKFID